MKNVKRIASLILALVMVFALATTAFAATVDNDTDHSYAAYQIFSGTQTDVADDAALADIVWGTGIDGAGLLDDLVASENEVVAGKFTAGMTAAEVAKVLADNSNSTALADLFANLAAENLKGNGTAIAAGATTVTLDPGYYLLVDTTTDLADGDALNSALLQVTKAGDIHIQKKYEGVTSDKDITKVTPKVTTNTAFTGAAEGVDAGFGDTVELTLTGELPSNYADYEDYFYAFHDTMSAGLTYVANSAKVYVSNNGTRTDITSQATIQTGNAACGTTGHTCNLYVAITDLKQVTDATIDAGSQIVVVYEVTLNGNAEIGDDGNPNEMFVEYSNNPNGDGHGNTPKDEVLVFTYELDTTKVDGATETTKLGGAKFVLLNKDKTQVATVDADGKVTGWVAVPADGTDEDTNPDWTDAMQLTSAETTGLFIVKGLDQGEYFLRETVAPAGYNLLTEDVAIVITATVTEAEETGAELTALNIKVDTAEAAGDVDTGIVNATVKNNKGGVLPETGGMGTTMFYVIGGILVLAAVVMLVTKKRMTVAE